MERTNSAGTTRTEEDEFIDPYPEVEKTLRTEDLPIFDGNNCGPYQMMSMRVNGRVPAAIPDLEKNIMEALGDPNIYMIGVFGEDDRYMDDRFCTIIRRATMDDLFGVIVMVSISDDKPDMTRTQREIARQLNFSFQEPEKKMSNWWDIFGQRYKKTIAENAKQLSDRIRTHPKILFILRDLHTTLDLTKLGIPFGKDHSGCKLILISQSEEILSNMNVQCTYWVPTTWNFLGY